jgi:NADH pyrophosphatase NudC (nudix superfamily)
MLNLDAYSLGSIQDCLTLLDAAVADGMELVELRELLAARIEAEKARVEAAHQIPDQARVADSGSICPDCGAPLTYVRDDDGHWVEACRSCRWSRYLGEI